MSEVGVPIKELVEIFGIVVVNFGEIICKLVLHSMSVLRIAPRQHNRLTATKPCNSFYGPVVQKAINSPLVCA